MSASTRRRAGANVFLRVVAGCCAALRVVLAVKQSLSRRPDSRSAKRANRDRGVLNLGEGRRGGMSWLKADLAPIQHR